MYLLIKKKKSHQGFFVDPLSHPQNYGPGKWILEGLASQGQTVLTKLSEMGCEWC